MIDDNFYTSQHFPNCLDVSSARYVQLETLPSILFLCSIYFNSSWSKEGHRSDHNNSQWDVAAFDDYVRWEQEHHTWFFLTLGFSLVLSDCAKESRNGPSISKVIDKRCTDIDIQRR
jgi:hypothetical protein